MQKQTTYQQLQPEDRITIASMRQRGIGVRAIARTLEARPDLIAARGGLNEDEAALLERELGIAYPAASLDRAPGADAQ